MKCYPISSQGSISVSSQTQLRNYVNRPGAIAFETPTAWELLFWGSAVGLEQFLLFGDMTAHKHGLHPMKSPNLSVGHLIVSMAYWGVMKSGTNPTSPHCHGLKEACVQMNSNLQPWFLLSFKERGGKKLRTFRITVDLRSILYYS